MQMGYVCAKYILFVFNLFLWLNGCALLAAGIWFLADPNSFVITELAGIIRLSPDLMKGAAIIIIVVGGVLFFVAGLGCCGACKENYGCIMGYAGFVAILIIAQIVAAILAGVFFNQILNDSKKQFRTSLQQYNTSGVDKGAWDFLQVHIECCGVESYMDWKNANWTNPPVPKSCCRLFAKNSARVEPVDYGKCASDASVANITSSSELHIRGCDPTFREWMSSKAAIIIGITVGVISIQIFVLLAACCLSQSLRNNSGTVA